MNGTIVPTGNREEGRDRFGCRSRSVVYPVNTLPGEIEVRIELKNCSEVKS